MSRNLETPPPAGITPADVYFVVFRHKWKILLLTLIGLAAAAAFYYTKQPPYQSEAKIFIRYITDSQVSSSPDNKSRVTSLLDLAQNVMNSEIEILTSYDLAAKVATNVGPGKILAKLGGGSNEVAATAASKGHLRVDPAKDSSVVVVTFSHADPDLVQPVLSEIITEYQEKSKWVHSTIGITDEALQEKITLLHAEIAQTEDELRVVKTNAGIISIAETEKFNQEEISRLRRELSEARATQFEHQPSLREVAGASVTNAVKTNLVSNVPAEKLARYKSLGKQLSILEEQQDDYLRKGYAEENKLMKENREQTLAANKLKADLAAQFPSLADSDNSAPSPMSAAPGPATAAAVNAALLPRRIVILEQLLAEAQNDAAKLNETDAKIADLERQKNKQEEDYKFYTTLKNQSRVDEQLGPNRVSNISDIQTPSPPFRDFRKFYKTFGLLAFGGLLAGLAWAFLIEFYFDRSVKRPVDLQVKLRIPFFLSIPDLNHNHRGRLAAPARKQLEFAGDKTPAATNGSLEVASPTANHALHSHYDALRDRLVNYFESINLTRKPKLVAVTSTSKGAGVSTISAGLAASLSETGDGRVLLVDMNRENGAAQQFVNGKAECKLDDALISDKRDNALVQENLYVVSEGSNVDNLPRILPKRFAALVPKLKASDYDYIIFDMPPVTQTSITTRLAGFMDTVMLVVESEKTDRDVVQQANQLLLQSKANVSAVLNKTRTYVPHRLLHDLNADA